MAKRPIVFASVVLCAAAFIVASSVASSARVARSPLPPIVSAESSDAPLPMNNSGQHLVPSSEPAAVTPVQAVDAVASTIDGHTMSKATAVIVGEYRYTDDALGTSIVPADALVWIVSVHGSTRDPLHSYQVPRTEAGRSTR